MLEPYRRGKVWWAKGRVEYNGRPVSEYYRCSTGASDEAGAWDWCTEEEDRVRRAHLLGEAPEEITFAQAVLLYQAAPVDAKYLIPIVQKIGQTRAREVTPRMLRDLGKEIYPNGGTDHWTRAVITPARAVINNAHDLGKCPPIRVKGYSREERLAQDKRRGKKSRIERTPGSWEWLLQFRAHASQKHAALALFMFVTGARISQAIAMNPLVHCKLDQNRVCVPGAKGQDDRWIEIPPELSTELKNLPVMFPRGWARKKENRRLFGFAERSSPRKGWESACRKAKIELIWFHAAGRHGFGQEMNVRQGVDEKAAGAYGGWSDTNLMRRTYTHEEEGQAKILAAFRTGLVQAEESTGLKLLKNSAVRAVD